MIFYGDLFNIELNKENDEPYTHSFLAEYEVEMVV